LRLRVAVARPKAPDAGRRRVWLNLEELETRLAPAATVSIINGVLTAQCDDAAIAYRRAFRVAVRQSILRNGDSTMLVLSRKSQEAIVVGTI
jgi:hypothetical protein